MNGLGRLAARNAEGIVRSLCQAVEDGGAGLGDKDRSSAMLMGYVAVTFRKA